MLSVKLKPYGSKAKTLSNYSDEQNIVIAHDTRMFTLVEYTSFIYINYFGIIMYKVNNTLTSAYGDMDLPKKQGPVRTFYLIGLRY